MKKTYLFLFIIFSFLFFGQEIFVTTAFSATSTSTDCTISYTLRVGSVGEEVKCLQAMVGVSADGHFGPLTKAAVVSWQLSHNLVIDGVVGPLTRATLNGVTAGVYPPGCSLTTKYSATTGKKCDSSEVSANPAILPPTPADSGVIPGTSLAVGSFPEGCTSAAGYSPTTGVKCDGSLKPLATPMPAKNDPTQNVGNTNPNMKNLDLYITAVKIGLLKGGLSPDKLPLAEAKIRKQAETGPDFRQEFFNIQKAIYDKRVSERILKAPILALLEKIIDKTLVAKKAFAAGLPFGGFLTYVNPEICDCPPGLITQVYVSLPGAVAGISNMLMDYVNKSQIYLNYNIPLEDIAVLGFYEPGVPSCWMYVGEACSLVESDGLISPDTGSSLAP